MSAYEQRLEPPDRNWQYLLFAAEPYETMGFKVQRVQSHLDLMCLVLLLIVRASL